jgi:hypothetical protein
MIDGKTIFFHKKIKFTLHFSINNLCMVQVWVEYWNHCEG